MSGMQSVFIFSIGVAFGVVSMYAMSQGPRVEVSNFDIPSYWSLERFFWKADLVVESVKDLIRKAHT